jgi:hypothetical protein
MAAGAAALPALPRIASAQAYPTRPVRIIVAAAAGGPTDTVARLIGQWFSDRIGSGLLSKTGRAVATILALRQSCARLPTDTHFCWPMW